MTFWLNGDFHELPAVIDIADRGFLLGDGAFETMLVERGAPVFLSEHLARLKNTLATFQIDQPVDDSVARVINALAVRNGLAGATASARITISRGAGARGLSFQTEGCKRPTMLITIPGSLAPASKPAVLMLSKYIRFERGVAARHKTLNYLDNVLARNEAQAAGVDDAIMLNSAGRVACVSSANLFAIRDDGVVITPPADEGALPGIVRAVLLAHGEAAGVKVEERVMERAVLDHCMLFVTNSLMGLHPAIMQNRLEPAPQFAVQILHRLQSCYQNCLMNDLKKRVSAE